MDPFEWLEFIKWFRSWSAVRFFAILVTIMWCTSSIIHRQEIITKLQIETIGVLKAHIDSKPFSLDTDVLERLKSVEIDQNVIEKKVIENATSVDKLKSKVDAKANSDKRDNK